MDATPLQVDAVPQVSAVLQAEVLPALPQGQVLQGPALLESVYFLLFLAGIGLMVAEAMAPGTHLLVLGIGVLTAGLVGMVLQPAGLLGMLALGAVVAAVTVATLWGYRQTAMGDGSSGTETSHSGSLRGTFGHVTETVTAREGEVKLDEGGFSPHYQARSTGGTIEEGTEVMVVDPGGGNVVTVEAVGGRDDIDRELARERDGTESAADDEDADAATFDGEEADAADGPVDEAPDEVGVDAETERE